MAADPPGGVPRELGIEQRFLGAGAAMNRTAAARAMVIGASGAAIPRAAAPATAVPSPETLTHGVRRGRTRVTTARRDEPSPQEEKGGADGWQAGQHVKHPKFGKGEIVSVIDSGDMTKLQVAFVGGGVKQLLAKIAKLEKI